MIVTSGETLCCEPTVSSLNDKIDFKISFDDSDDEDYMVIFDKKSFSYKIISTNDLKMDSKNDNEKVNMTSLPSHVPTVSCFDDLDFFNDFENEFPAIVYNDAQTSKLDLSTEPTLCPQHIDDFDLKDETSLSEYDEKEQNILKIGLQERIRRIRLKPIRHMAPLPPHEQRYPFLGYQGLKYTDADIADFEERLEMIHNKDTHRVQVVDFQGMPELMRDVLDARMLMEHHDDGWVVVFTSRSWRFGEVLLDLDAPSTVQFQLGRFRRHMSWREFISESERMIPEKGDLRDYWRSISTDGDFLGPPPSYTLIIDLGLRLCHRMMVHSIAGRSQAPEKSGALIFGGQFVARLAEHFGLLTEERLQGLTVIMRELLVINMTELVRLQICEEIDDTWAWVALGPKRQPDAMAGAPGSAEDAPVVDEGDQAVSAPIQAPPPPPATARTMPQRMDKLEEDVHKIRGALAEQCEVIGAMARDFSRFAVWVAGGIAQLLDSARVTYTPTKTGTKFSTIAREYISETSTISKQESRIGDREYFKSGSRLDTTYWGFLGVGVLIFILLWSLVSASTDTPYLL
ncbi:hypothetical protein Tco_0428599 [Tanacetum coccineum]